MAKKITTPNIQIKTNFEYPIGILKNQMEGIKIKIKYCKSTDHSQATQEQQKVVEIFLASTDDIIFALKKAIKKLES